MVKYLKKPFYMFNVIYNKLNESNNIKLKVISVIECLVSKSITLDGLFNGGAKSTEFHLYCLILSPNFFFSLLQNISYFDNFFFEFFISFGQSIALDLVLNDMLTSGRSGSQNTTRSFRSSSANPIRTRMD